MTAPVIDDWLDQRRLDMFGPDAHGPPGELVLEGDGAPAAGPVDTVLVRESVIAALRTVYDPEIPLNIYDLGLVYAVDVTEAGAVSVDMTLTAPGCPVAGSLLEEVQSRLLAVSGVSHARTRLVWDPPWTHDRLSDAARLELGLL